MNDKINLYDDKEILHAKLETKLYDANQKCTMRKKYGLFIKLLP